jgi:hypothetical protein
VKSGLSDQERVPLKQYDIQNRTTRTGQPERTNKNKNTNTNNLLNPPTAVYIE